MTGLRNTEGNQPKSAVVAGGGLAGLAAACALADAGVRVTLLERRPYVGGRASSYEHPGTGEVIDNCQHVLLGCCTNLIDLYERLGVSGSIRWFNQFTFVEPGGRRSVIQPSGLPAPLHASLSFAAAPAFSIADKIALSRGMAAFLRGIPGDSEENFAAWLARHGQTHGAIERFWKPLMVSALNEDLDRVSVHYAAKVVLESFLKSPDGGAMGVPGVPLSELYGRAVDYITARGGSVHLRTSAEGFAFGEGKWTVQSAGQSFTADALVLALSFEAMAKLLPLLPAGGEELAAKLERFEHSPITGIHLWFDREVTDLDHAVLLDATIQWMYNKTRLQQRTGEGSYLELVVSASRSMVPMQRQEILDLAVRELGMFFPVVREAKLVKGAVVKEVRATYSVRPLLDRDRPSAQSPWPGVFLAGDWTATDWPATMEGAVRSGYLAAEAMLGAKILLPDLEPEGLMRMFG